MKLPVINIVDYLVCLSTKCFIRGSLIWNSNASPKMIFDMLNTKYTRSPSHRKSEIHVIDVVLDVISDRVLFSFVWKF